MANFYLCNPIAGWAAVCISKNACTALKARVLEDHGEPRSTKKQIHDAVGYSIDSEFLRPVDIGRPVGQECFAVWRDPVARFLSTYQHFAVERARHDRLGHLHGESIDCWIAFAEAELTKPTVEQDEHLRPQSLYFGMGDVDFVIPIEAVGALFEHRRWGVLRRINATSAQPSATPQQRAHIARIYEEDFSIRVNR
jgi:hypothetical protein